MNIIYYPSILTNITGNTNDYSASNSAITSNIFIASGFTLNLNDFDNNIINRIDIIYNIIDYVDEEINKYQLDIVIVDNISSYDTITQTGQYCIKFYYQDKVEIYNMMNIQLGSITTTTTTTIQNYPTTTTTTIRINNSGTNNRKPIIYYNSPISGTTWIGSGTTIPHDVYLNLYHDGITGWTLDNLKTLFISEITGCFDGNISLNNIIFNLYEQGTNIQLSKIIENGTYYIYIKVKDSAGNITENIIYNIIVNYSTTEIIFKPNILMYLTGNTSDYSGVTTGITNNINIYSGFTLNIDGFDENKIDRIDIIDNVVDYVKDSIDTHINKYMIEIIIIGNSSIDGNKVSLSEVIVAGYYFVNMSLKNSSGNKVIYNFIMLVTSRISIYSEGYWQDNKVWIDSTQWLDYPKL